jgi:hypothetical protein
LLATEIGVADVEQDIHVRIAEAIKRWLQFRQRWTLLALQWIEISPLRTKKTIGRNQLRDGDALTTHLGICRRGNGANRTLLGAFGKRGYNGSMRDIGTVTAID